MRSIHKDLGNGYEMILTVPTKLLDLVDIEFRVNLKGKCVCISLFGFGINFYGPL